MLIVMAGGGFRGFLVIFGCASMSRTMRGHAGFHTVRLCHWRGTSGISFVATPLPRWEGGRGGGRETRTFPHHTQALLLGGGGLLIINSGGGREGP